MITGSRLIQNPLFSGYAAVEAYLSPKKIAIDVAVTFDEEAFDQTGGYTNSGDENFLAIDAYLAPAEAPRVKRQEKNEIDRVAR